ncbi:hypothetical protein K435DRAFT_972892 [Dendrothele bispora CBS 962.96]|uniref:Uncharacterized protein n=1 Tax=Dendrothele bispora (strain CBS 962.96) TaxID=1314807 RepID=A0A4S8KW06_DENBC|nr:hypothetical protein K435DRAFT_972892 [Dendrothele bispora CBS 962.96]
MGGVFCFACRPHTLGAAFVVGKSQQLGARMEADPRFGEFLSVALKWIALENFQAHLNFLFPNQHHAQVPKNQKQPQIPPIPSPPSSCLDRCGASDFGGRIDGDSHREDGTSCLARRTRTSTSSNGLNYYPISPRS